MLGGELIRSAEVLDFRQDGSGVQAGIRRGAEVQTVDGERLVGADGVGSTVREQLGIGFKGVDYSEHFLLADVPWDAAPWSNHRSHGFLQYEGLLLALPLLLGWRRSVARREPPQTPLVKVGLTRSKERRKESRSLR